MISKEIVIEELIVVTIMYSRFFLAKHDFSNARIIFQKLDSLISNMKESWKLLGLFVMIRPTTKDSCGLLQHADLSNKILKLYI